MHFLYEDTKRSMSAAGNAFTTTVLQANLLALLVHSDCWRLVRLRSGVSVAPSKNLAPAPAARTLRYCPSAGTDLDRPAAGMDKPAKRAQSPAAAMEMPAKRGRCLQPSGFQRGCKRKQASRLLKPGQRRVRKGELPQCSKHKRGRNRRGKVLDLATKAKYVQAYLELKKDPEVPHPQKHMLQNKGRYPGLYAGALSKWMKQHSTQHWARIGEAMPRVAKKHRQVPR